MQRAAHPAPIPPPTTPALGDLAGDLRAAWTSAAASATGTPELAAWLDSRLDELETLGRLDQDALSEVIDAAAARLHDAGLGEVAPHLVRRLLRCVYESLLAVDAHAQHARGLVAQRAPTAGPNVPPELGDVAVLVRQGQLDDAAAALATLARRGAAGRQLVSLALETGDRCRAAGRERAASDCYVAAWTTDRLDERPLWSLASLALAAGDVELALSYLHEVVALLQWRGDARGAARVSRKMSVLAPDAEHAAVPAPPAWPGLPHN